MDGAALSAADVSQISRLPSRDVLYGQLVGLVASPIAGLARTLNALIGGLAVGLGGVLEAAWRFRCRRTGRGSTERAAGGR